MTETTLHAETLRLLTVRFGYSERRAKDIINIPENWRVTAAMRDDGKIAKAQALANIAAIYDKH